MAIQYHCDVCQREWWVNDQDMAGDICYGCMTWQHDQGPLINPYDMKWDSGPSLGDILGDAMKRRNEQMENEKMNDEIKYVAISMELLRAKKINAIKFFRRALNLGLKESKDVVEDIFWWSNVHGVLSFKDGEFRKKLVIREDMLSKFVMTLYDATGHNDLIRVLHIESFEPAKDYVIID